MCTKKVTSIILVSIFSTVKAQSVHLDNRDQVVISGNLRNFFMSTDNVKGTDYWADALAGNVKVEYKPVKHLSIGVSASYLSKVASSDLDEKDLKSGKSSKWERELFDLSSPENTYAVSRFNQFYLKYQKGKSKILVGKIPIEYTPLVNPSDGRMLPIEYGGLSWNFTSDKSQVEIALLNSVSMRSNSEWLKMKNAIGVLDNGFQPDGSKADYLNENKSAGVAILHYGRKFRIADINFYNIHLDKTLNTSWFQLGLNFPKWDFGLIYSYQIPDSYQGRLKYSERYVQPDENGQVASFLFRYKIKNFAWEFAYSKAFDTGRFLFPKELGRDQFFTSLPRSRMEGFGNVDVIKVSVLFHQGKWSAHSDFSISNGASENDFKNNKYNTDDFLQWNSFVAYKVSHKLEVDLLYIIKRNLQTSNPIAVYQKTNYDQLNLITNYWF